MGGREGAGGAPAPLHALFRLVYHALSGADVDAHSLSLRRPGTTLNSSLLSDPDGVGFGGGNRDAWLQSGGPHRRLARGGGGGDDALRRSMAAAAEGNVCVGLSASAAGSWAPATKAYAAAVLCFSKFWVV